MSTTQVKQNLIQVNRWRFVNALLVREDDGFALVDTTVGGGADELIAAARTVSNHFYLRFPPAAMPTWDKAKDLESAKRLRELDPAMLVVGHGGPVRDPGPAMDKAISSAGG